MNLLHLFQRRLRALFHKGRVERDMAEEMRFHLAERTADKIADGLSPDEARYAAQRQFGNVASLQEQAREGRGWNWLENLFRDFHLSVRTLTKSPGFTVLAIVTLALGIGANTAMYNVMNGLLRNPLPYADSEQLDRIDRATVQNPQGRMSPADFLDLQREMTGYGALTAYALADTSLSSPGEPAEMARGSRVTANFFSTLGVPPQLGRDFHPNEEVHGNDHVVILSQRVWQNRFGGKTDILGRTIRVDGEPHEIIGVMPASFNDWRHLGGIDFFRPLALDLRQSVDRVSPILRVIGRRASTLSRTEAAAMMANFGAQLAKDFPAVNAGTTWRLIALNDTVMDNNGRSMFVMLIGLSGFVVLIACSNLANLLLARTIARAREFAVRAALGASRTQLLRPLIAEALLLAGAGGALAMLVARWMISYLEYRSTGDNGERALFALDWRVFAWAFGASLVTALAFGLAPALFALRLNLNATLKSGGRGATGGRGHQRFRQLLIVGQFALALILFAGAALFVQGLNELNHRRAGWDTVNLITGSVVLPSGVYPDADHINAFHRLALEKLSALPGAGSVSVSTFTPFFGWADTRRYIVEGQELPERGHEPAAMVNRVSGGYFATMNTHLLAGRVFNERDTAGSTKVFIINQAMATGLFGDKNPIGQRLARVVEGKPEWGEIVGVAVDVKSVVPEGSPILYQLYQPMAQEPAARGEISLRTTGVASATVIESMRAAIMAIDPDLPMRKLQSGDASIDRANYQLGVLRDMLGLFAVLGLGLASLGIYGVIARTMAQRTHEFAIRLALGATIRDITRLVLGSGLRLALIGSAIGLVGAFAITRFIVASYPGMHFDRVLVLVGTTVLLVGVALMASWLPARRAGKVDAMIALRAE